MGGELARLCRELENARAETESHRQLIRALQERLSEQEQQAESNEGELRRELERRDDRKASGSDNTSAWLSGAKLNELIEDAPSESGGEDAAEVHLDGLQE